MSKQFYQIQQFNQEVLGINPRQLGEQDKGEFDLSVKQLKEEVREFEEARASGDFIKQIDALIDLQYFTIGVLYKLGINADQYEQICTAVHGCNMMKKVGVKKERGDHGAADAIKPDSWKDPEQKIIGILHNKGA